MARLYMHLNFRCLIIRFESNNFSIAVGASILIYYLSNLQCHNDFFEFFHHAIYIVFEVFQAFNY